MPVYVPVIDLAVNYAEITAIRSFGVGYGIWSEFSHVTLVLFVCLAFWLRNYVGAVLGALLTVVSMFYHGCASFDVCAGLWVTQWQWMDHGTAPEAIIIVGWMFTVGLYVAHTTRTRMLAYALSVVPITVAILFLALQQHPVDLAPTMITILLVAIGFCVYYMLFFVERLVRRDNVKYWQSWNVGNYLFFAGGLIMGVIAVGFFCVTDPTSTFHSFWHFFVGIALCLFQGAVSYQARQELPPPILPVTETETASPLLPFISD